MGQRALAVFEDISKVTPYEGTPSKLKKTLFTKINTANGPTLEPQASVVEVPYERRPLFMCRIV